jgi:hypothetical protein
MTKGEWSISNHPDPAIFAYSSALYRIFRHASNCKVTVMDKEREHKCINKTDLLLKTEANIDKYGLQVIMVGGTDYSPSFAYSIGLFETYKHPEIICFGLPDKLGHEIINDVADLIKTGEAIKTYRHYSNIFKDSVAQFIPVDAGNIDHYFRAALNFYGATKFPAYQLVWTDRNNKLPWEENFEQEFLYKQPLLDRNMDFKFREAKNLGVFTTRQWLELDKPILQVVHDSDGDWQFLTGDQMPDDIRLVSLEQIILRDKTLNETFFLNYGCSLEREFVGGAWTKAELEENDNE